MQAYLDVVRAVLQHGTRKPNRTGVDTLSCFALYYQHNLQDGFPLLTTKAVNWRNIVVETLWYLTGQRTLDFLHRHGCHFWDAWQQPDGTIPSPYGFFWRHFPSADHPAGFDQVRYVLEELARNPQSRRLAVSAWQPGHAQDSRLPPCHVFWVLNAQYDAVGAPRLCLHLTQRSCDIALGVPYNLACYSLLLSLLAQLAGLEAGTFAHSLIDAHIYTAKADGSDAEYDHCPGLKTQLSREPRPLPRLTIHPDLRSLDDVERLLHEADTDELMKHFRLEGYDPHPSIHFKVAV